MNHRIMPRLRRAERRQLLRARRSTKDARLAQRIRIVELYDQGFGTPRVAALLGCAPATAVRVVGRYRDAGFDGLVDGRRENGTPKIDEDLLQALREILLTTAERFGWPRPTWTRELLVKQLEREAGVRVSVTTLARMLVRIRARWGTPRPIVACPWPKERKQRKIRKIRRILRRLAGNEVAFYVDEVDIHLNPKIGRDWMLHGVQRKILTPGQNKKRYLAGALAHDGSDLVFVEAEKKNTDLFLMLLNALKRQYPNARKIHLVLDNYCIHSSHPVKTYLAHCEGLFNLLFLPPYCPDFNKIERKWRDLHANVTRNHRCTTIGRLMDRVRWYLRTEARRMRRLAAGAAGVSRGRRAA